MPKSARAVPKEIATFGEKQFKETGAAMVEVLRVKAAVMRKHFKQLKGITFLVAVIARDRVRIYFFNAAGVMLVGENVELTLYAKIRSSSKLIAKFEKPRELTPEEQRIEATQELRDSLARTIRRVTRFLSTASPNFPDIFVTRISSDESSQSFGLHITEDGEYLFEESAIKDKWAEGLIARTAFLSHLDTKLAQTQIASIVGSGIAIAILKGSGKKAYLDYWLKVSKETNWLPIVNYLVKHIDCYSSEGFARLFTLLQQTSSTIPTAKDWIKPLNVIHDGARVSIGTEEYYILSRFCQSLVKPRKLNGRKDKLESIHLAPRVICDPTPLEIQITLSEVASASNEWASVSYLEGANVKSLHIGQNAGVPIQSIEYWLNLEDIYPSSGGLVSHGKSILQRARSVLGISDSFSGTFESVLEFSDVRLSTNERAVLERLALGQLEILVNTLVGSPQIVESLLQKGRIIFLPNFNHLGVDPDYLMSGRIEPLRSITRRSCLEGTIFGNDAESLAVVSAPSDWKKGVFENAIREGISIWPIMSVSSPTNVIRSENPFPEGKLITWTNEVS
ncbi:MAG: hypothetical protein ACFFE2_08280 [Candidatus Thorarchaeota archaeon]